MSELKKSVDKIFEELAYKQDPYGESGEDKHLLEAQGKVNSLMEREIKVVQEARIETIKLLKNIPHEIAAKVYNAHDNMSESDFVDMQELDKLIGQKIDTALKDYWKIYS